MAKYIAKLTARGKRDGEDVVVECVETTENGLRRVDVFQQGGEPYSAEIELALKASSMLNLTEAWLPEYGANSLASYWVALHEVYFDEPPEITITGDFSTIGLPYGTDEPDGTVF